MQISVFGLGYVGAVSCACLAELGHRVVGVDIAEEKVHRVRAGRSPILEPGLDELLRQMVAAGRLTATADAREAVAQSELAMLCVGTPSTPLGGVDTSHLEAVCRQIGEALSVAGRGFFAVVVRSTCLPPVHRRLSALLAEVSGCAIGTALGYVCHPEFLREGAAIDDFRHPPKIVFGASDPQSESLCRQLYLGIEAPTFCVPLEVASLVKYADNCFHALKVTFANEIGLLSRQLGVDAGAVMEIFCQDQKLNLSPRYLRPGAAFGGSCLPKDLRALLDAARMEAVSLPMLSGVLESNRVQIDALLARLRGQERSRIGIVGLAFKEGTDDVRESPLVAVVEHLTGKGYPVRIYDAHLSVASLVGRNRSFALAAIPHLAELLCSDLQEVVGDCDALVVSHRLTPAAWARVHWRPGQRVLDLANVPELRTAPGYEGLYW